MLLPAAVALALSLAVLGTPQAVLASEGPRPPCGGEAPVPAIPAPGGPPDVQVWHAGELPPDWRPPPCTGWGGLRFDQLVGLAGRLPASLRVADLLARLGAFSAWTGTRYWSESHGDCRELVADAYALAGPKKRQRRPDFAPAEMTAGKVIYFFEEDTGPSGGAVYRMRLHEVTSDRLVVETENVSAIKVLVMPLFGPGDLRAFYVAERGRGGGWTYYGLNGATVGTNPLALGHDNSYVNRALALYAHLAGLDPCSLAAAREASR